MKTMKIMLLAGLFLVGLAGCEKQQVGFLQTENAHYVPNTMDIRLTLDEELDAYRIYYVAPWVSPKMQGVVGTSPITFEIVGVTSETGNAEMFRSLLTIRGGGRMEFPLVSDITPGEYHVSVKVTNEGHSRVLNDVFVFYVKE